MPASDEARTRPGSRSDRVAPERPADDEGRPAADAVGAPASSPPEDAAAISLLRDILAGDRAWTLADVGRLVVLRDLVREPGAPGLARREARADAG